MEKQRFPESKSSVTVTFIDGEIKEYVITASSKITQWLMHEAAASGFLVLRDDLNRTATSIPVHQIRDVQIRELAEVYRDNESE